MVIIIICGVSIAIIITSSISWRTGVLLSHYKSCKTSSMV